MSLAEPQCAALFLKVHCDGSPHRSQRGTDKEEVAQSTGYIKADRQNTGNCQRNLLLFKIRRGEWVNGGSGIFHLLSCYVIVCLTTNPYNYCTQRQPRLKSAVQRRRPKTADSSRRRGDVGRAFRSWCL